MNITPEAVGIILAVVFPLSALVLWAIKTTVAPLQVVIENNTAAMNHIRSEEHTSELQSR